MADFKPPAGVVNNAKQAIEWREKYPKETADAGKTWANRIYKQIQNNKSFNTNNMNDIQYKSFEIKAFDKLKGIITGYGATYGNVDLTNEVVLQGSLDDDINAFTNGTKIIEFLYEHNSDILLNSTVDSLKSDSIGMFTQASVSDVAKATYKVEWERFATYCSKGLGRMSIGYRTMNAYVIINGEKKYYIKDGQYDFNIVNMIDELKLIKYLEKLTLYEVSFTGNPANPQARILGIKNNRGRVAEGMEMLEMSNFKTKSEFQMALEGIKNADGTFSTVGFSKFLDGIRKGKYQLTQNGISKFVNTVDSIYKGKMPKQEIEKMLDNQNNDVKAENVPQDTVAQDLSENKSVPQNQTFADVINAAAKNFKK